MLGCVVLFHCVVSYMVTPVRIWPFKDDMTTVTADLVVKFLDVFQMPIFFVLAGFFAATLYVQRGAGEFARNRAMRIGLPFAVGWLILHPLFHGGFVFARTAQSSRSLMGGLDAVRAALMDGSLFFQNSTMHLWFIYDLIYFYVLMLALAPIVMRAPAAWREWALVTFGAR